MDRRRRARGLWSYLRGSVWVLPALAVTAGLALGLVLADVQAEPDTLWAPLVFEGGADGARGLLQVIAGSLITVTSLMFSLVILVLQNAASQYSPRLLRTFLRDLGNQLVLATFLGTFAFALAVLPSIKGGDGQVEELVPRLAVTVALLLTMASVAGLVYLIHNMTQSIRVDAIMRGVQDDTVGTVRRTLGHDPDGAVDEVLPDPPVTAAPLFARRSGYIQSLDPGPAMEAAEAADARVAFRRAVGEYVTEGSGLAWAWVDADRSLGQEHRRALEQAANRSAQIGYERTLQEDIAFGLRQLTDIAVKALSPGINDPSTAVDAVGRLSVVLHELSRHRLGSRVHRDGDGVGRVGVRRPAFSDYLDLVCWPIAHYGARDKTVVRRLLRLLEDIGGLVDTDGRHAAIGAAIDLLLARSHADMDQPPTLALIDMAADKARHARPGRVPTSDAFVL